MLLSYTRDGYLARRLWWPPDPTPGALAGRHVLVTGATSGIGLAAAAGMTALGARVHVLGHDPERLRRAVGHLAGEVPGAALEAEECDVTSLAAVREFAAGFARRVPRLHALVHNAGMMAPERTETAEGNEATLATHVLGPFLLTRLLRGPLGAGGDARVVVTSSGGMYAERLHVDVHTRSAGTPRRRPTRGPSACRWR